MISVDVGGTFTDVVTIEAGTIRVKKVPTTPSAKEKGVVKGLSLLSLADKKMFNHTSTAGLNYINSLFII